MLLIHQAFGWCGERVEHSTGNLYGHVLLLFCEYQEMELGAFDNLWVYYQLLDVAVGLE